MADCELLHGCIFFNDRMSDMPSTAEVIKMRYCRGDNSHCARFMVCAKLGRQNVPTDLFPNQKSRAESILAAASAA